MNLSDPLCHTATLPIGVSAEKTFEFMTNTEMMGRWAFGAWELKPAKGDILIGKSLFEDLEVYCRIKANRDILQLDYEVGEDPVHLVPRIISKIIPGEYIGRDADSCLLSMISWRSATASDERWRLTCGSHEAEVFRIRHLVETQYS